MGAALPVAPDMAAPLRAALKDWLEQRDVRRACDRAKLNLKRLYGAYKALDQAPPDVVRAIASSLLSRPQVLDAVARRVAQRSGKTRGEAAAMLRDMAAGWRAQAQADDLHAAVVRDLKLRAAW